MSAILERLRRDFLGLDRRDRVCTLDGGAAERRRVYLDTTATALMPRAVWEGVARYFEAASANSHTTAHRAGRATTEAIERAREAMGRLVGYDPAEDVVLLPGNGATGAINFVARALFPPELRMPLKRFRDGPPAELEACLGKAAPEVAEAVGVLLERPLVVTTVMEHHSNILPWVEAVGRHNLRTVGITTDGRLDTDALARVLEKEGARVRLVAVAGASNVTGVLVPVHEIARMAHAAGARVLVDGAQLAPHRPIDLHAPGLGADAGIDFLAMSGHKLYAPGSRGVLVGTFAPFERRRCIGDVGGGMVEYVSIEDFQVKDEITAREEAGTPNIPGTIALGLVATALREAPMSEVAREEGLLVAYALGRLRSVPGVRVFGPEDPAARVGVFAFTVEGLPYGLVAAYLDDFHDIAVRDGCFCAHPYVKALLGVTREEERRYLAEMAQGDRRRVPGMVRASLGLYSTRDDVDALADALAELGRTRDRVAALYRQDMDGAFHLAASQARGGEAGTGPGSATAAGAPAGRADAPLFSLDAALDLLRA